MKLPRHLAFTLSSAALFATRMASAQEADGKVAPSLSSISNQTGLLRVVAGLAFALLLAVLAQHRWVRRAEQRLGLTVVVASGLPFIIMGVIFRHPSVGILTDSVVDDLRPALEFGIGWLGFVVGMQFDVRGLDKLPEKTGAVVVAETVIPILTTAVACLLFFTILDSERTFPILASINSWGSAKDGIRQILATAPTRDALALGACAAQTAPVAALAIARSSGSPGARVLELVSKLDDISGIVLLGLVCAFFRPSEAFATWKLPHIAWLFVTLGLGGILGILTYVLLRSAKTSTDETAYLLGAIALSAGMSGYLGISPMVTGAIAGALLANLPVHNPVRLKATIQQVERPLYLIFLLVAGALWNPMQWQGWVLCPVFVLARIFGKIGGARLAKRYGPAELPDATTIGLALAPQSPIAIATIVSFVTLYKAQTSEARHLPWLMTALIGGAVLTEITIQGIVRLRGGLRFDIDPRMSTMPPPPALLDETDLEGAIQNIAVPPGEHE